MNGCIRIGNRLVGPDQPCFIIAELSANHGGSLDRALSTIREAAAAGADAIKLQTYTADTLTIPSDKEWFTISGGLWDGRTLYDLYQEAHTPWEWHPALFEEASRCGLMCFSTPFDDTAVDYLESFSPPCYKLASFELVDHALIARMAKTGRPVIFSTGMATLNEILEAIAVFRDNGCEALAGLRCVSSYPADPADFNLRTIATLAQTCGITTGISDHSLGPEIAVAAVAMGASVLEKHFILQRSDGGPDAAFSMEPTEFRSMVDMIRRVESAMQGSTFEPCDHERANIVFRRSLFVTLDIEEGEPFTARNVRSIRPGYGLPPKQLPAVLGRCAAQGIAAGTPLTWDLVGNPCKGKE